MQKLATIVPGQTTAQQVEQILNSDVAEGSTPAPLWNDLVDYAPPLEGARTPAHRRRAGLTRQHHRRT